MPRRRDESPEHDDDCAMVLDRERCSAKNDYNDQHACDCRLARPQPTAADAGGTMNMVDAARTCWRAARCEWNDSKTDVRTKDELAIDMLATFAHAQRLALLQSLLDEELNTHGGKSTVVGTWLRTRMEEEKARG